MHPGGDPTSEDIFSEYLGNESEDYDWCMVDDQYNDNDKGYRGTISDECFHCSKNQSSVLGIYMKIASWIIGWFQFIEVVTI